jgi:hypothetical protein
MDCLKLGQLFLNRSVPPENYSRTVDMVDPVRVIAAPLVHAAEGTEPTVSKPLCKIIGSAKRLMKLAKLLGKFFSLEKHPKSADLSLKRLSDKPLILHAAPARIPTVSRYDTGVSEDFRQTGNNVALSRALLTLGPIQLRHHHGTPPGRPALAPALIHLVADTASLSSGTFLASKHHPRKTRLGVQATIIPSKKLCASVISAPFITVVARQQSVTTRAIWGKFQVNALIHRIILRYAALHKLSSLSRSLIASAE